MGNIQISGPNEIKVISGGWFSGENQKYINAGWGFQWWWVSETSSMNMNVITLNPRCTDCETIDGVPITVTGVAQLRVMYEPNNPDKKSQKETLRRACQNFIGLPRREVEEILKSTLEGHLRGIIGSMSVEGIYQAREELADAVEETAALDLARMGIEILNFVLKDIQDSDEYITSLGCTKIADVNKTAKIGDIVADRDAVLVETECEMDIFGVTSKAEIEIQAAEVVYKVMKANCDRQINSAKAESKLAYDIEHAIQMQTVRDLELEADVIAKRILTDVEKSEVIRRDRELEATQRKPAEFQAKKISLIAEGGLEAQNLVTFANAARIRLVGAAEADAIWKVGEATAKGMEMKADAMAEFQRAAMVNMILEAMPRIAAQLCEPLQDVCEIVLTGAGNPVEIEEVMPIQEKNGRLVVNDRDGDISALSGALHGVDVTEVLRTKIRN